MDIMDTSPMEIVRSLDPEFHSPLQIEYQIMWSRRKSFKRFSATAICTGHCKQEIGRRVQV